MTDTNETPKAPRHRSPNHPVQDLKAALDKIKGMLGKCGRHPVTLQLAAESMGHTSVNSHAKQLFASLKYYGLLDATGSGRNRKLAVSESCERILKNAPDKAALLQHAALAPKIHQEVWEHFEQKELPQDDVLKEYLVWGRPEGQRFNPEAVDGFIERLRGTFAYAGIFANGTLGDKSDDDGEEGSFVNGTEEDVAATDSSAHKRRARARKTPMTTHMKEDVYTVDAGDVVLQWPARMSDDERQDLDDWLDLMKRKIKRSVVDPSDDRSDDDDGSGEHESSESSGQ